MLNSRMVLMIGLAGSIAAGTALVFSGCGKNSPNSNVNVAFGSYTARNSIFEFLMPSAYAALSNTKLCFKRVRFKQVDEASSNPATAPENIDFEPGEITINAASSTTLGTVNVPAGTYKRVEFDLDKSGIGCTSGNSVTMTNANGSYISQDGVTIRFEGTFTASAATEQLTLGLQSIVNALNTISGASSTTQNDTDIKAALEGVSVFGDMH